MQNKNNEMLVQLSTNDLFQLITEAVKQELNKITEVIKLNPKDSGNESNIISRTETAKLLGVSLTTLFIWNRDSILKAKKIGRRVYYLKDEVLSKLKLAS